MDELAQGLVAAVARTLPADRDRVSLLFSGGLDSSLIALLSVQAGCGELELVTVGLAGSRDLAQAERAAGELDLPWHPRILSREEVEEAAIRLAPGGWGASDPGRSIQTGLSLALAAARHPFVLCGQGADELFLGYAHFRGLTGTGLQARYDRDWAMLRDRDWPYTRELGRWRGKAVASPYLDEDWRSRVELVPLVRRASGSSPKMLLREIARNLGLPRALCDAPKRALQYGSGIDRVLRGRGTPAPAIHDPRPRELAGADAPGRTAP